MESEKPVIDFARVRTFTWVIGVGSPAGARRRGDHRPDPAPFPADDGTPSSLRTINLGRQLRAQNCVLKTVGGGGYGGARLGKCNGYRPADDGPGNHPPSRRTPLDNQSTSRGDARVKRRAAAASPAPWSICQKADVQRDGDAIADRMLGIGDHRPLSFVSWRRRPCVWYVGHGRREATSDRLMASAERPLTIIPLTTGLSVTGKKPVSANRLPVSKNKLF